jgi:hypothetical protein
MPLATKTAIYATSVYNYLHKLMFFDSSVKPVTNVENQDVFDKEPYIIII